MESKSVSGYEGIYTITSDGLVVSKHKNAPKKTYISNSGYERVVLFKNGIGKKFSVHRLVAEAFVPNPNHWEMVNHKDGNKLNNLVSNLEWCDASHNMKHAFSTGLAMPKTTRVIQYTKDFKKVREWESIKAACDELGLNHANIVTVCNQKTNRKYAGGYAWRYANGIQTT